MAAYQLGNTVRLTAVFKDWANQVVDPTLVKLKVYNSGWALMHDYSLGIEDKLVTGEYYFDYTIPYSYRTKVLYIEWYGEIQGTPSIKRITLNVNDI